MPASSDHRGLISQRRPVRAAGQANAVKPDLGTRQEALSIALEKGERRWHRLEEEECRFSPVWRLWA
jgi:hypothetical protein